MDTSRTNRAELDTAFDLLTQVQPPELSQGGLPVWGETIGAGDLLAAAQAGLTRLRSVREQVNAMNVFPIPDGDTGTNMVMTMQSACEEAGRQPVSTAEATAAALAHGALVGARGNSGVILSQLWRGFAAGLRGCEAVCAEDFARAWREASRAAYESVGRPVEGTILTVSADVASAAQAAVSEDVRSVVDLLARVVAEAHRSVQRTPDLLPILRQAGVTDSGAAGLFFILEGMLRAAYGEDPADRTPDDIPVDTTCRSDALEVEPGQDWEVVVDLRLPGQAAADSIRRSLARLGTSLQIGQGDGWCRVHIHVADGCERLVTEALRRLGAVCSVNIENLRPPVLGASG